MELSFFENHSRVQYNIRDGFRQLDTCPDPSFKEAVMEWNEGRSTISDGRLNFHKMITIGQAKRGPKKFWG